jgi:hypothetical protein
MSDTETRNDLSPAAATAWRGRCATHYLTSMYDETDVSEVREPGGLPVTEATPQHVDDVPGYRLGGPLDGLVWD